MDRLRARDRTRRIHAGGTAGRHSDHRHSRGDALAGDAGGARGGPQNAVPEQPQTTGLGRSRLPPSQQQVARRHVLVLLGNLAGGHLALLSSRPPTKVTIGRTNTTSGTPTIGRRNSPVVCQRFAVLTCPSDSIQAGISVVGAVVTRHNYACNFGMRGFINHDDPNSTTSEPLPVTAGTAATPDLGGPFWRPRRPVSMSWGPTLRTFATA